MADIRLTERITAPADRVFAVASDIAGTPKIFPQIVRIEMLAKADRPQVGMRWRETRKAMGKEASVEIEITRFDPPRSMTMVCEAMGARFETVFTVTPDNSGTLAEMDTRVTPGGLMSRLMMPMIKSAVAKGLREDLQSLKRALEAEA